MDLYQFAQVFGFPAACLIAVGFGVWRIVTYVVTKILTPIAERHIQFLDKLESTQAERDATSKQQAGALTQMVQLQGRQGVQMDEQTAILKRISGAATVQAKIAVEKKAEDHKESNGS